MIEIDGSRGEGGGQILRTSLSLALLTGQAFHLRNIRARRPKTGLQPQHLMAVKASQTIGKAEVKGASIGSSELTFTPGTVTGGNYQFPIGTAGATSLVFQTIYYPLAMTSQPSTVSIEGGTHVLASPCFHFLDRTWRGYMEYLGLQIDLQMRRPGFYPRGGGLIEADIEPCRGLGSLILQKGPLPREVFGFSAVAGLPASIAQRQAQRVYQRLKRLNLDGNLREETWHGGPGTVVAVELPTTPAPTLFFGLGEKGKTAERVADEAIDQLEDYLESGVSTVDFHSADQLLLPLALSSEPSSFPVSEVTQHLLTNREVISMFLKAKITVEGDEGEPGTVGVEP